MSGQSRKTVWISHRGLCQQADENSLASFTAAVEAGFDYLETDLRATLDGAIVLCHDQTLDRTGTVDVNVSNTNRKDLAKITLAKGSQLLFLDEFISHFADLGFVFDIKPETGFKVIELLAGFNINFDKTIFLCWNKAQQKALLKAFPQANCFAQEPECKRAGFAILMRLPFLAGIQRGKAYSVTPYFKGISLFRPRIIAGYHRYGAKALAYLPETLDEAQAALDVGVDFVLSNHDFGLCSD